MLTEEQSETAAVAELNSCWTKGTKLLPRQKHESFVRQLGMKDIRHLIVQDVPCPVPSSSIV
jgi:hypothetical protein